MRHIEVSTPPSNFGLLSSGSTSWWATGQLMAPSRHGINAPSICEKKPSDKNRATPVPLDVQCCKCRHGLSGMHEAARMTKYGCLNGNFEPRGKGLGGFYFAKPGLKEHRFLSCMLICVVQLRAPSLVACPARLLFAELKRDVLQDSQMEIALGAQGRADGQSVHA